MTSYAVEFIGGPLDGHTHAFTHSPDLLAWITGIPVSPDLVRFISGQGDRTESPATSIAVYQLHHEGDELRYYHLCSVSEEECQCEGPEARAEP